MVPHSEDVPKLMQIPDDAMQLVFSFLRLSCHGYFANTCKDIYSLSGLPYPPSHHGVDYVAGSLVWDKHLVIYIRNRRCERFEHVTRICAPRSLVVNFGTTLISASHIQRIGNMPLKTLHMSADDHTYNSIPISFLQNLKQLQELGMHNTGFTDAHVAFLKNMPLKKLIMRKQRLQTSSLLVTISQQFPHLRHLSLASSFNASQMHLGEEDLQPLSSLTALRSLDMSDTPIRSLEFVRTMSQLDELAIHDCISLPKEAFSALQRVSLHNLSFHGNMIDMGFIQDIKHMPLMELNCGTINWLTDDFSRELLLAGPRYALRRLVISDSDGVTSETLRLLVHLPSLRHLFLELCFGITDLSTLCPLTLDTLKISYLPVIKWESMQGVRARKSVIIKGTKRPNDTQVCLLVGEEWAVVHVSLEHDFTSRNKENSTFVDIEWTRSDGFKY